MCLSPLSVALHQLQLLAAPLLKTTVLSMLHNDAKVSKLGRPSSSMPRTPSSSGCNSDDDSVVLEWSRDGHPFTREWAGERFAGYFYSISDLHTAHSDH